MMLSLDSPSSDLQVYMPSKDEAYLEGAASERCAWLAACSALSPNPLARTFSSSSIPVAKSPKEVMCLVVPMTDIGPRCESSGIPARRLQRRSVSTLSRSQSICTSSRLSLLMLIRPLPMLLRRTAV